MIVRFIKSKTINKFDVQDVFLAYWNLLKGMTLG